jgi:hypothetical protein
MVKLSDIELPLVYKNQLLFKSGIWNKWNIDANEVNKSPSNTKWNKLSESLIYEHKDNDASSWIGKVKNVKAYNGEAYGDIFIYDLSTALKLKEGEAPFAVSAGIAWSEKYDQPKDFVYRNFSLVADPGVRDKDIFINFSCNDEIKDGLRTANFSNTLSTEPVEGEQIKEENISTEQIIENKEIIEEVKEVQEEPNPTEKNSDYSIERRLHNEVMTTENKTEEVSTPVETSKPAEAVVEQSTPIEASSNVIDKNPSLEQKIDEMAKILESNIPKVQEPQVNPVQVMDTKTIDEVANKVVEKILPSLKPAPVTVNEFGGEPQKDDTDLVVEKLTKELYSK